MDILPAVSLRKINKIHQVHILQKNIHTRLGTRQTDNYREVGEA